MSSPETGPTFQALWALRLVREDLSPTERHVLLTIVAFMGADSTATVSVAQLVRATGLTDKTITKGIDRMLTIGALVCVRERRGYIHPAYSIDLDTATKDTPKPPPVAKGFHVTGPLPRNGSGFSTEDLRNSSARVNPSSRNGSGKADGASTEQFRNRLGTIPGSSRNSFGTVPDSEEEERIEEEDQNPPTPHAGPAQGDVGEIASVPHHSTDDHHKPVESLRERPAAPLSTDHPSPAPRQGTDVPSDVPTVAPSPQSLSLPPFQTTTPPSDAAPTGQVSLGIVPPSQPPQRAKGSRNPPSLVADSGVAAKPVTDVRKVYDAYVVARSDSGLRGSPPILDDKRTTLIRARLAQGFTVEDLIAACQGVFRSQYHVEGGYTSLDLVVRDAKRVEQFREILHRATALGGMVPAKSAPSATSYHDRDVGFQPANPEKNWITYDDPTPEELAKHENEPF